MEQTDSCFLERPCSSARAPTCVELEVHRGCASSSASLEAEVALEELEGLEGLEGLEWPQELQALPELQGLPQLPELALPGWLRVVQLVHPSRDAILPAWPASGRSSRQACRSQARAEPRAPPNASRATCSAATAQWPHASSLLSGCAFFGNLNEAR